MYPAVRFCLKRRNASEREKERKVVHESEQAEKKAGKLIFSNWIGKNYFHKLFFKIFFFSRCFKFKLKRVPQILEESYKLVKNNCAEGKQKWKDSHV